MVLLFGLCFLLLLISAPIIVLGVGMRGAGKREPKNGSSQSFQRPDQEP
jgi:hypothetical protein